MGHNVVFGMFEVGINSGFTYLFCERFPICDPEKSSKFTACILTATAVINFVFNKAYRKDGTFRFGICEFYNQNINFLINGLENRVFELIVVGSTLLVSISKANMEMKEAFLALSAFYISRKVLLIIKNTAKDWGKESMLPNNRLIRFIFRTKKVKE